MRNDRLTSRVVLFLGAPGSGKGTQSSWLSSRLGIPVVSTGEILRAESKGVTPAAARLRQTLASGSLVSDEVVCGVMAAELRRTVPRTAVILDGFPRTVDQAACLDEILRELGTSEPVVVHLDLPEDVLVKRLTGRRQCATCGAVYNLVSMPSRRGSRCEVDGGALVERDDDSEGVVRRRLRQYDVSTAPLVDYYRGAGYYWVDGNRDPHAIEREILSVMLGRMASLSAA